MRERRAPGNLNWNRNLSHWFSRRTENVHMIGSFYFARKWKVCFAPPISNVPGRKGFLALEILVINLNWIKRSQNTEETVWRGFKSFLLLRFHACYDAINIFGKLGIRENLAEKLKQTGGIEVTPDCKDVLPSNICRKFSNFLFAKSICREVQKARFWLNSRKVFAERGVMRSHKIRGRKELRN